MPIQHYTHHAQPRSIEALSQRLGPNASGTARPGQQPASSAAPGSSYEGGSPRTALRSGLGLVQLATSGATAASSGGSWAVSGRGPLSHVEDLRRLGQQLLSGSGSCDGDEGLAPEVLVSAARQQLMALEPQQLSMQQAQLLAADYVLLSGIQADQLLSQRCVAVHVPRLQLNCRSILHAHVYPHNIYWSTPTPHTHRLASGEGSVAWPEDALLLAALSGSLKLSDVARLQQRYAQLLHA